MNWFDNVSTDSDQPIAPARLVQGHWRHRLDNTSEPMLCRVVIDVAEPRVVAAQVIDQGTTRDLGSGALEDLTKHMVGLDAHHHPSAWGLESCAMLPAWARPTFSEKQIEELQRIEGYLTDASEDTFGEVLQLRDDFLRSIGMTDLDIHRAVRQPQSGTNNRKCGRGLLN